jgi:hypothetical protein
MEMIHVEQQRHMFGEVNKIPKVAKDRVTDMPIRTSDSMPEPFTYLFMFIHFYVCRYLCVGI